jgi:RNA polymerase sigma-70 factor, ECF subfamily
LTAIAAPLYGERRMTTTVDASDGDLARAIAAPDPGSGEAAETELYRRFAPRVRLYGLRHLRDEEAAPDLMQQVLLLTIEKLREGAVRDMDSIGSFILGASRMLATNLKRRERRREALREAFLAEPTAGPEEGGAARDADRLEGCLTNLSERERMVVLLSFYGERSSQEIARTLNVSEGNVRVIRCRAIDRLRTCLAAKGRTS